LFFRSLFVSGGSGLTPLVSMARHLQATGYTGRLAWVHYARREVILGAELDELARGQPDVQIDVQRTRAGPADGATAASTSHRHAAASYRLVFARSGREARGHGGASLLAQAEQAGLRPRHGCRIGICHRCRCVKRSGVVRNELTGLLDDEPGKAIQLCITTPCSDVTLEL